MKIYAAKNYPAARCPVLTIIKPEKNRIKLSVSQESIIGEIKTLFASKGEIFIL